LDIKSDGVVAYNPIGGGGNEAKARDKQRIANLGLLCLAYIHSPGIEVEHVEPDPAVNRKRVSKGKAELPDYYVCRVSKRRYVPGEAGAPSGRHVSFRFDVRGHFRRLPDGRTIWIRSHQRGVEHEFYRPKSYRVD
jgi:hypothetical protein